MQACSHCHCLFLNVAQGNDGAEKVDVTRYKSIMGWLIFLTTSRLNIVDVVSSYMNATLEIYLKIAKRLLSYVKGIIDFVIHYYSATKIELAGQVIMIEEVVWMIENLLLTIVLLSVQDISLVA